jgi:hypothetical protein
MVTKTNKECGNAWRIEEIAIEKGAVDTIMARMGIASQKDLWHKAKKLMAKFVIELCEKGIQYTQSVEQCSCKFDLTRLTNATLQGWLKNRGLPISGVKSQLVATCIQVLGFEPKSGCENLTSTSLKFPKLVQHDLAYKMKS